MKSGKIGLQQTGTRNKDIRPRHLKNRASNRRMSLLITNIIVVLDLAILGQLSEHFQHQVPFFGLTTTFEECPPSPGAGAEVCP
jgi:hypothetical protein